MSVSVSDIGISRRDPKDDFELVQRVGSGTYGDVYKVSPPNFIPFTQPLESGRWIFSRFVTKIRKF